MTRPRRGGDPIALLPAHMRGVAHDRTGWVLLLLWVPLLAAAVALGVGGARRAAAPAREASRPTEVSPAPAPGEAGEDASAAQAPAEDPDATAAVQVTGVERLELGAPGAGGVRAFSGGGGRARLEPTAEGAVARGQGGEVLFRAARDDEQIRVLDGAGGLAFRLKLKDEGYAVHGPDGALLCRVKVKEDKFNVYDAAGKRVRHGKWKRGRLLVRDEADRQLLLIDGAHDLGRAGLLAAAPVPELVRGLLWTVAPPP